MANLLVTSAHPEERRRLEEQFPVCGEYFQVGQQHHGIVEAIFRSITFQYYQNTVPLAVQKIITFAQHSLHRVCSLTLLREIVHLLYLEQSRLSMYDQYFLDINRELGQAHPFKEGVEADKQGCSNQQNQKLFDLASRGELKFTRYLQGDGEDSQTSIKVPQTISISEKTQLPTMNELSPECKSTEQLGSKNDQLSHIFKEGETYYGREWWHKGQQNESSREISRFACRESNALLQRSIGRLVMEELKYDVNRELQLGKEGMKGEGDQFRYKKMMKAKLMRAKLKKRRA